MTSPEAERTEPTGASAQDAFLLYDGECPFCSFYARKSKFKTQTGRPLTLIDANRAPDLIAELRAGGCEVEEGMVLVLDGRRYQGASAMTGARGDGERNRLVQDAREMVRLEPCARARFLPVAAQAARRGAMGEGEGQSRPMREGFRAMGGVFVGERLQLPEDEEGGGIFSGGLSIKRNNLEILTGLARRRTQGRLP